MQKVAFIGAGNIARSHMPSVSDRDASRIAAVCDVDEDRAREVAETYDARPYTDQTEMLDQTDPDAVYVCIPPFAHGDIELELAERNIPFCVEKPVHLDLRRAVQVAEAVRASDLVTSVGYQVRYAPQIGEVLGFLQSRDVSLVQGWFIGGLPPTPWWRRKERSGGQIVEQATHTVDLMRMLAGEIDRVHAVASTGAMTDIASYDVEDATVAALQFDSGAAGQVSTACVLCDGGSPRVGLRLDGRDYTVDLTYTSLSISSTDTEFSHDYPDALPNAMRDLDNAFLDAVADEEAAPIRSTYGDAVRSLAVSLAINQSLKTGQPVRPDDLLQDAGMQDPE
jgi:predicted dehydrogenase